MVNNGHKQQTGLVLPTVKRPTVFLGGLGFEVDMTAIHETDAVGDLVVVLEGLFDEGSLDGRWPGEQRWGPAEDGSEGSVCPQVYTTNYKPYKLGQRPRM